MAMPKAPYRFACALLLAVAGTTAAAPMNKCVVNGTVTYQQAPCPSGQVRRTPTLDELNAAERQKRAAAAAAAASAPPSRERAAPAAPTAPGGFVCDGRTHCSQMRSCAEATYFLANCPGVKMDGDRNGIPCEQQWCGR
jgi:predicted lipid-binding transport protein (Tim44 family)